MKTQTYALSKGGKSMEVWEWVCGTWCKNIKKSLIKTPVTPLSAQAFIDYRNTKANVWGWEATCN